jgi:hypothetical protein
MHHPKWEHNYPCESFLIEGFKRFYNDKDETECSHEVVIIQHPTQYNNYFQYAQRCKKCWAWMDWYNCSIDSMDATIADNKYRRGNRYYFNSYQEFFVYCQHYLWAKNDFEQWWRCSTRIMLGCHRYFMNTSHYTKEVLAKMQRLTLVGRWV